MNLTVQVKHVLAVGNLIDQEEPDLAVENLIVQATPVPSLEKETGQGKLDLTVVNSSDQEVPVLALVSLSVLYAAASRPVDLEVSHEVAVHQDQTWDPLDSFLEDHQPLDHEKFLCVLQVWGFQVLFVDPLNDSLEARLEVLILRDHKLQVWDPSCIVWWVGHQVILYHNQAVQGEQMVRHQPGYLEQCLSHIQQHPVAVDSVFFVAEALEVPSFQIQALVDLGIYLPLDFVAEVRETPVDLMVTLLREAPQE